MTLARVIQGVEYDSAWDGVDRSTNALYSIDYEHHEIHAGNHYFVGGAQDLTINKVLEITMVTPNTTKWSHWTWKLSTESETAWSIYEGATIDAALANAITPKNNDRNSLNTSGNTLKYEVHADLTAANAHTDVSEALLLDNGISGAGKDAGSDDRSREIILKQNTIYCLRAVATAAGHMSFHMHWYEHTNKNVG